MDTATQTLHRLTSYEAGQEWDQPEGDPRVVKSFASDDLERLPWFWKRYDGSLPRVALARELPATSASALEVMAGAHVPTSTLDPAQLARLLHLSAGVVRTAERPYGTYPFRAAGSAGARFPLELYVAVPAGSAIEAGIHWYDPMEHALVRVGPPPFGGAPTLVVTGVPWRTGWRYRERGYRHIYWDAGSMLAQTLAVADSAGLDAKLFTLFPDQEVAALVGADRVHEFPIAVVTLGEGHPGLEPSGPSTQGRLDADPVEFPLITLAQRAGERSEFGPAWDRGEPVDVEMDDGRPVEAVVLERGSQRLMDPGRGLPAQLLSHSMRIALRGIDLDHRVVVNHVEGLEPGLYRWPDLSASARAGNLRGDLYHVALEQGLARDAAFVAIAAADVGALDDREYRDAHLAAGLVSGRLHLLAYALGASASGMTFRDSDIPDLLGERLDGLLFTCVGVPAYRSAPGGLPGAPTSVRTPLPRIEDRGT